MSALSVLGAKRDGLSRLALVLAVFVNNANFSATTVALPSIQRSFDLGFSGLQWAVTAYLLTYAGFMLVGGSLGDAIGLRRVLVGGSTLYFVALLVVAFAADPAVLFTGRALQGVAAAMVTPTTTSAARTRFSGTGQVATIGLVVGMSGIAQAIGPPLGGVLDQGVGWQAVFLVNLPLLAVAIGLTLLTFAPDREPARFDRVDLLGATQFAGALALLTVGITEIQDNSLVSLPVLGFLAASALVFGAFVRHLRRFPRPLVEPELFASETFRVSTVIGFAMTLSLAAILFFEALYFERARGSSAIHAGLLFLPMTALFGALSTQAGRVEHRFGDRLPAIAGLWLACAGTVVLALQGAHVTLLEPLAGLFVVGLGLGIGWAHVTSIGLRAVSRSRAGQAAGVLFTARWIGGTLGIALLSVMYRSIADGRLNDHLTKLGVSFTAAQHDRLDGVLSGTHTGHRLLASLPAGLRADVLGALHNAANTGISWALAVVASALGIGALLCLLFPEHRGARA